MFCLKKSAVTSGPLQCLLVPIFGAVRHCQGCELGDPRKGGDDIPWTRPSARGLTHRRDTVVVCLKRTGYHTPRTIPLVDDDFPKVAIGVVYPAHSYSSKPKMGFVEFMGYPRFLSQPKGGITNKYHVSLSIEIGDPLNGPVGPEATGSKGE